MKQAIVALALVLFASPAMSARQDCIADAQRAADEARKKNNDDTTLAVQTCAGDRACVKAAKAKQKETQTSIDATLKSARKACK